MLKQCCIIPLLALLLRDFNAFVRACEKYGRKQVALIASEVDGKNEEEVRPGHQCIPSRHFGTCPGSLPLQHSWL